MNTQTHDTVKLLHPANAIIAGGSDAVSDKVRDGLLNLGIASGNVTRIEGADRVETAERIEKKVMRELKAVGYTSEPHAAIAYRALRDQLNPGEYGLFLGTAHPAKFKESVEAILGETLPLPKELADRADLPLLSHELPADFAALRKLMMTRG